MQILRGLSLGDKLRSASGQRCIICHWWRRQRSPLSEPDHRGDLLSFLLGSGQRPRAHWVALGLGFTGVLIALRPGLATPASVAVAAPGSATFYSLYLVLTRKVSGDEDSLSLLFHANAIGAIVLTIAARRRHACRPGGQSG